MRANTRPTAGAANGNGNGDTRPQRPSDQKKRTERPPASSAQQQVPSASSSGRGGRSPSRGMSESPVKGGGSPGEIEEVDYDDDFEDA